MKKQWSVFLGIVTLLLLIIIQSPLTMEAQGENLLKNPGFEEGHYNQDGITEITVPNGWRMHWSNREANIFNGYAETARPETVVWNIAGAPEHEKNVFWKDGIYTVKIFKGWAPMWAAMSQDVSGLEPGRKYRLVAPVYIDIVADYSGGQKVPPTDGSQGRVRLGTSLPGAAWRDEAAIAYSGWWTGENISPFYQAYPTFIHEFTATAPEMTVWIEVASNYPHPNNGFFIDTVGLYALDEFDAGVQAPAAPPPPASSGSGSEQSQPAPAAPTAAPQPTATPRSDGAVVHIVQPGDSFWSLAIQYAETMGITPEEALTAIPELNGNPSVISNGMELIIVPPSDSAADAPAEGEEMAANDEATPEVEGTEEAAPDEEAPEALAEETDASNEASESSAAPIAAALPSVTSGSICVQVYEDNNNDGVRADQGEDAIPDQAVTLSQDGNTLTTFITDGSDELHCFEELETGTYQVQMLPSADYAIAGDDSWAVAVAEGEMIPVSFRLAPAAESMADAGEQPADMTSEAAPAAPEASGGLTSNIGLILIGAAGLLIVVAGAGVYLLRRG